MNPNLTQSRRGAEKEGRGHGRLDRERHSTAIAAKPHDSMVGLARRCRPKPQARMRRLQCQERKRNSPLRLGSLTNRTLASRRRTPKLIEHTFRKCQNDPVTGASSSSPCSEYTALSASFNAILESQPMCCAGFKRRQRGVAGSYPEFARLWNSWETASHDH